MCRKKQEKIVPSSIKNEKIKKINLFDSEKKLIIGAEDDWIPYSRSDGTGMSNDIVRAAYEEVGIKISFKIRPFKRLLSEVEAGNLLAGFNVGDNSRDRKLYLFGKKKLFSTGSYYYQNSSNPLKVSSSGELKNREKIGVVIGYTYGEEFLQNKKIEKIPVKSETQNLKKLSLNRIDGTIIYEKAANIHLKKLGLIGKVEKAFPNEKVDIYVVFSRKIPESQYYADKLDEGLEILEQKGLLKKIIDSY